MRALARKVGELRRLGLPFGLLRRFWRWQALFVAREFAWQLAVAGAAAAALLVVLGAHESLGGSLVLAAVLAGTLLEARLAWSAHRSLGAVSAALEEIPGDPAPRRFPRAHVVVPPLMLVAPGVKRTRGITYHREGSLRLRLDVYRPDEPPEGGGPRPAVIQVHGGGWIMGSRAQQGIPLLNHLAANGWVGFNVDYRLSPRNPYPAHVVDVKRAIAWVRANAAELGVDPDLICITGGSAGGHLSALAALTAGDAGLQPGFEEADTSVAAAVPFYGVYDFSDPGMQHPGIGGWLLERVVMQRERERDPETFRAASPTHRVHSGAPPFLVFHGDADTLVRVDEAREFVAALEAVSENPVLYAELPGAEHAFDLFPTMRTARVAEGIERFLRTVVVDAARHDPGARGPARAVESASGD